MDPAILNAALARSFVEEMSWPIDRASLTALRDLGLAAEEIAHYFGVDPAEVRGALAELGGHKG